MPIPWACRSRGYSLRRPLVAVSPEPTIAAMGEALHATLEPLLDSDRSHALVDFPNHSNVGDSAIWIGERRFLDSLSVKLTYVADEHSYSATRLRGAVGDGPILLHGGGNLGDIWLEYQALRERVIAEFPSNPIIQLPQTIFFQHEENLARAKSVFDSHPDLTLLLRDDRSFDFAVQHFECKVAKCPDMAFGLGPSARRASPVRPILWLARTDAEAPPGRRSPRAPDVHVEDWMVGCSSDAGIEARSERLQRLSLRLGRASASHGFAHRALGRPLLETYDRLALMRLAHGRDLLGSATVVVTDRLHGHILSLLLGIPHVLMDNSYGKVRAFYDAWTSQSEITRWARSSQEALETARDLVAEWSEPRANLGRADRQRRTRGFAGLRRKVR